MKRNLKSRAIIIAVTLLICILGVIGIPKSWNDVKQNFRDNIRLGLDLRGGSHLVLQVQVQDAVKADADQTVERLKEELKKQNITWTDIAVSDVRPDHVEDADNVTITMKGIPATMTSAFREPDFGPISDLQPDDPEFHRLLDKLKPSRPDRAEERYGHPDAMDTIGNRINQLGLSEKSVQQYGRAGSRLRDSGAVAGRGRSGASERTDRHGGGTRDRRRARTVRHSPSRDARAGEARRRAAAEHQAGEVQAAVPGRQASEWYLLSGLPVITGKEMRNAAPGKGHGSQLADQFHPFARWRPPFRRLPETTKRQTGGGPGQPDCKRGHDQ